jgi:hypothetical protein
VDKSAVFYAARSTLTRAKSFESDPIIYIPGKEFPKHVQRWVHSDSVEGEAAHLVEGFRHNRPEALLSEIELDAYWGRRPDWWPVGDESWTRSANNSMDYSFWASVCNSACIRQHRDDVELITLDMEVRPALCQCYKYTSFTNDAGHAAFKDLNASHSAPSDFQLMEWLHASRRMPNVANRSLVQTYAVQSKPGTANRFVDTTQSTTYYARVLDGDYHMSALSSGSDAAAQLVKFLSHPATLSDCIDEATNALGASIRFVYYRQASVVKPEWSVPQCEAGVEDFTALEHGYSWLPTSSDENEHPGVMYWVNNCPSVRAGSERSLVWNKASNKLCSGQPVAPGFTLGSHTLRSASTSDFDTSDTPFDIRCKNLCIAEPQCATAHVFGTPR